MTDQPPNGPEPGATDQPQAGQPYPGSTGGAPPEKAGLSTGCLVSLIILAVVVILFGVCIAVVALPPA